MRPRRLWTASFWLMLGAMGACVVAGKGLWLIGCGVSLLALVAIEGRRVRRDEPRLFAQGFFNQENGEACIWGAVAVHEGKVPEDGWLLDLNDGELGETASWVSGTWDCPFNLAWSLADENDNGRHDETPEARYARILRLVQRRIIVEATS